MKQLIRIKPRSLYPNKLALKEIGKKAYAPFIFLKNTNKLFYGFVIVPTSLAFLYFGILASDVYVSESSFVIHRSLQTHDDAQLGALFSGFSNKNIETSLIHDYMLSRDVLMLLNKKLNLYSLYKNQAIDRLSRYPTLGQQQNFETLHQFYNKHVSVTLDADAPISTLRVRAFTAKDAFLINKLLLELGEQFINHLNVRSRNDLIDYAKSEVLIAENRAKKASLALSDYRIQKRVLDPNSESTLQLKQVLNLQTELIATKNHLTQLQNLAPNSPQILSLQNRIQSLETVIYKEKAKIIGEGASLAIKTSQYERLLLERTFAYKQLAVAMASLTKAQLEAQHKQLYLEKISSPSEPEVAVEPHRIRNMVSILILGLLAYGICSLLIANVKEHFE